MEASCAGSHLIPGRRALPALVLMMIVLLGACDASSSTSRPSTTPSPRSSAASSTSTVASPSPRPTNAAQLLYDARGALFEDSSGFHASGTIAQVQVSVDFTYGSSGQATGTITQGDGVLKVRQLADGTRYARGNSAWFAGSGAHRSLSAVAGRWVVVPKHNPPLGLVLADLANRGYLYDGVITPDVDGPVTGPRVVDGIKADVIVDGTDTYAFAAVGPPRPIRFVSEQGEQRMRFDHYDAPLHVTAPPAREVVALPHTS